MAAGPFSAGMLMCLGSAGHRLPALDVQSTDKLWRGQCLILEVAVK